MTYENFFTNVGYTKEEIDVSENFDEKEILTIKTQEISKFLDDLIYDYLKCNRHNALNNKSKVKKIICSHYLLLGGIASIGILLLVMFYAIALNAIPFR